MATFFAFSPPPKLAKLLDTEDETVCVCLAKFPQVCACQMSVAVCMALLHSCRLTLDEGFVCLRGCATTATQSLFRYAHGWSGPLNCRGCCAASGLQGRFSNRQTGGHCMAAASCMHISGAGCAACA